MSEGAVVNASPLIYLAHAGMIYLLETVGPVVAVPTAVSSEIRRRGASDPTVQALEATPWLQEVEVGSESPRVRAWDLGPGETAVLSWALKQRGLAVLDDLAARRCAAALDIPLIGTLGLVLRAKQEGRIGNARQTLEKLRQAGMYLGNRTLDEALALVGE